MRLNSRTDFLFNLIYITVYITKVVSHEISGQSSVSSSHIASFSVRELNLFITHTTTISNDLLLLAVAHGMQVFVSLYLPHTAHYRYISNVLLHRDAHSFPHFIFSRPMRNPTSYDRPSVSQSTCRSRPELALSIRLFARVGIDNSTQVDNTLHLAHPSLSMALAVR